MQNEDNMIGIGYFIVQAVCMIAVLVISTLAGVSAIVSITNQIVK
ncbi:MAG: hypothetical protein WCO33_03750 [bacterium]